MRPRHTSRLRGAAVIGRWGERLGGKVLESLSERGATVGRGVRWTAGLVQIVGCLGKHRRLSPTAHGNGGERSALAAGALVRKELHRACTKPLQERAFNRGGGRHRKEPEASAYRSRWPKAQSL